MPSVQYTTQDRAPAHKVARCGTPDCTLECGCECGTHDSSHVYYVGCGDAGRYRPLLGPFPTHLAALSAVDQGRKLAEAYDSRAVFYSFGTFSCEPGTIKPAQVAFSKEGISP